MRGIALKLWAGMMALVVLMLLMLWLFQVVFLQSFYQSQHISRVTQRSLEVAEGWNTISLDEFKNGLEKLSVDYNARIDIFDSKGNFQTIIDMGPRNILGMAEGIDIAEILKGKVKTFYARHHRLNSEFAVIGIPLNTDTGVEGGFLITVPLAPVKDTVGILKVQLIYLSIFLFFVSIILSFLMSKLFTRPILKIKDATEKMASGDMGVRLRVKSRDEIGKLADTVNHLAVELSKVEELRRDLIANVSHELRTPLSLIRGYAETIRDVSGENREKRVKQLEIIIEESERLRKIVDDILNLSQMQAGYSDINMEAFRLDDTLKAVTKRYELLAEKTSVEVEYGGLEELMVIGNESRIEQVLYNLLNNAFNYTPENGIITIRATAKDSKVRVEVSDTGPGIPDEDLHHIWDRFYRSEKTDSKRNIGTGLGLAIVKTILESHKAEFGVKSKEGEGTTFWFELDKAQDLP